MWCCDRHKKKDHQRKQRKHVIKLVELKPGQKALVVCKTQEASLLQVVDEGRLV